MVLICNHHVFWDRLEAKLEQQRLEKLAGALSLETKLGIPHAQAVKMVNELSRLRHTITLLIGPWRPR